MQTYNNLSKLFFSRKLIFNERGRRILVCLKSCGVGSPKVRKPRILYRDPNVDLALTFKRPMDLRQA
jgi:hypothetical protein